MVIAKKKLQAFTIIMRIKMSKYNFIVKNGFDLMSEKHTPQSFLIETFLPEKGTCIYYGNYGSGKTTFVLQALFSCMSGLDFFGQKTSPCRLFYWCGDGEHSAMERIKNYIDLFKVNQWLLKTTTSPLDLSSDNPEKLEEVINAINTDQSLEEHIAFGKCDKHYMPDPLSFMQMLDVPLVIVFDTVASVNLRENELSHFLQNIKTIQQRTNSLVLLIHHIGKDPTKGARGHSSVMGAVDHHIRITKPQNSKDTGTWELERSRATQGGLKGEFKIVQKEAPFGNYGTTIVEPIDEKSDNINDDQIKILNLFDRNITKEEFDTITLDNNLSKDANRMRKNRSIDKLKSYGYIEKYNDFYMRTNKPTP